MATIAGFSQLFLNHCNITEACYRGWVEGEGRIEGVDGKLEAG